MALLVADVGQRGWTISSPPAAPNFLIRRRGYGLQRSRLRIDGDDEGTLPLDHLPSPAAVKAIRLSRACDDGN
jgi:hypothetical protein